MQKRGKRSKPASRAGDSGLGRRLRCRPETPVHRAEDSGVEDLLVFLRGNSRLESSNPRKFGQNWAGKCKQKLNQHLRQDFVGSKPQITLQNDRSIQRQIGAVFWEIFEFMVGRRKIKGKFVINLALDTNMLEGNPSGWPDLSRISARIEGKAVEGGKGMKSTNARTQNTIHTDNSRRWQPVQHNP